jgi:hypothetical protein
MLATGFPMPNETSDREVIGAVQQLRSRTKASPARLSKDQALARLGSGEALHDLTHELVVMLANRAARNDAEIAEYAMWAGHALKAGHAPRQCLWLIANWKARRRREETLKNDDTHVTKAIQSALESKCAAEAVVILGKLKGVGVPMASAILTCLDVEKYTVIDVRALDALGLRGTRITPEVYRAYLNYCCSDAQRLRVPLRTLDLALWYYGMPY